MKKLTYLFVFCVLANIFAVVVIQYRPTEEIFKVNETLCVTGCPCTYQDVMDFRVIVITFNRPDSLSKLFQSLNTLVLDGDRTALEIWIDRDRRNTLDKRTIEVASAFIWKSVLIRIHVQVIN